MCQSHDALPAEGGNDPATRKVLVVQTEPTLRLAFSYALSNPTTKVETAPDGNQTMEMMAKNQYHLIILELRMPGMDGIDVIENLRKTGNRTPVVLCTTIRRPYVSVRSIALGVVDFLLKPALPANVRGVVDFVLDPPPSRLSQALVAMRDGDPAAAIQILENHPSTDLRVRYWLKALTLIRNADSGDTTVHVEDEVRSFFPLLAFNPPAIP